MNPESSPFSPGQPVPIEFFTGRKDEVERLRGMVRAAKGGRFKIGFVTGERGIGKSSLTSFVRHLTEREDEVAGCHVLLGGVRDLQEMVRRTFDRLLKESIEKPWHKKVRDFFGSFVKEVGLFGISLQLELTSHDLAALTGDFVPTLRKLLRNLANERKALLLILDDINGLASSAEFANWLKSVVDEIATSEAGLPLCLLVVGLEERRTELIQTQPSLARVFELITITPWSDNEVTEFFRYALERGGASCSEEQLKKMVMYTGGLPVLAHEIGDAVWRAATMEIFSDDEVMLGIIAAAEVIGLKLLEPQVLKALRSERYRSILRKTAGRKLWLRFKRSEINQDLNPEEQKVLDNFLRRMCKLGAIIPDEEGGRGTYRFPNRLNALYFWMESQQAKREK